MIRTFACKDTESLFMGRASRRWLDIRKTLERKLQLLDSAASLEALGSPPGNRLEALKGKRSGQHSIRINQQWRICFVWRETGVFEVEIVDYH